MKGMLEKCKNLSYAQTEVKIMSAVSEDNLIQIENLAKEFC